MRRPNPCGERAGRSSAGRIRRPRAASLSPALVALAFADLGGWIHAAAASAEVLSAEQILQSATIVLDGRLHLLEDDGSVVPLITDPHDPEIRNPGDGAFHPASVEEVERSLAAIDARFGRVLEIRVLILPYPRSGNLRSTARYGRIYLSPGVLPYAPEQIRFLIAHEVGHLLHQQHLPDHDLRGWKRYREIRGIEGDSLYHPGASHARRPHEIFAEDFRILFGGDLAGGVPHENGDLADPRQVPGLRDFLAGLLPPDAAFAGGRDLVLGPNPFRPGQPLSLRIPGGGEGRLEIIDLQGRRVAEHAFHAGAGDIVTWYWDGRDTGGRRLPAGTYFARILTATRGSMGRIVVY